MKVLCAVYHVGRDTIFIDENVIVTSNSITSCVLGYEQLAHRLTNEVRVTGTLYAIKDNGRFLVYDLYSVLDGTTHWRCDSTGQGIITGYNPCATL